MEEKPIKFADQTWLTAGSEVMEAGDATSVGTIAHIAAIKQIARDIQVVKEGDQIEWKAELKGRITVDRSMLNAAIEQHLR
jgi:hypothetical protein